MCIDTKLLMAPLLTLLVVLGGVCLWQWYRIRTLKQALVRFIQEALKYKYAGIYDVAYERKENSMNKNSDNKYKTIICPKCKQVTSFIMQRDAIDEQGEFYRCQHCGWPFQYR